MIIFKLQPLKTLTKNSNFTIEKTVNQHLNQGIKDNNTVMVQIDIIYLRWCTLKKHKNKNTESHVWHRCQ